MYGLFAWVYFVSFALSKRRVNNIKFRTEGLVVTSSEGELIFISLLIRLVFFSCSLFFQKMKELT